MSTSLEATLDASVAAPGEERARTGALPCVQRPATGWAGAATLLTLYISYTSFQGRLTNGGPNWTSLWGFPNVARDYIDVLLCLFVTFLVMVTFEKATKAFRALSLFVVAVTEIVNLSATESAVYPVGQELITLPELAMATAAACLMAGLLVDLLVRRSEGLAPPVPNTRAVSWRHAFRSGGQRWLVLWSIVSLATLLYLTVKNYAGVPAGSDGYYTNWRMTACAFWWVFTFLGLPVCVMTVKWRSRLAEDRSDAGLMGLLLVRRTRREGLTSAVRLFKRRRFRVVFLDLCVKGFWVPLMVTFLFGECGNFRQGLNGTLPAFHELGIWGGFGRVARAFFTDHDEPFLGSAYHMVYHSLFVVDCGLGLLGYISASRWLGNKSKSVETTLLGWAVAMSCYPPFNSVLWGSLFPYDTNHGPPYRIFTTVAIHHVFMALTLMLFFVYGWATVVFGLRFSNVTHRGVISTGPFRYIRHPAYATKNLAWWTESILNFGHPIQFVYLLGVNGVYTMRALTEERHLMQFEDYRRYAKTVRWRFFPGVF